MGCGRLDAVLAREVPGSWVVFHGAPPREGWRSCMIQDGNVTRRRVIIMDRSLCYPLLKRQKTHVDYGCFPIRSPDQSQSTRASFICAGELRHSEKRKL